MLAVSWVRSWVSMVQLPCMVLKLAVAFRSAGKSEKASLDSVGNDLQCLWDVWEAVEVTILHLSAFW